MKVDNFLRELLFRKFRIAGMTVDFLEALLAVCITGVGLVLRASFPDSGMPHLLYLLAEWYLAVAGAVLVHQITGNGRKSLLTYSVLLILPTVIADGTILRNNACVGALLIVSALLFLENGCGWLFSGGIVSGTASACAVCGTSCCLHAAVADEKTEQSAAGAAGYGGCSAFCL